MTKVIVYDRPGETDPVVRLRLKQIGNAVTVEVVNAAGLNVANLIQIGSDGTLRRCMSCEHVPGLQTDESGRIKLRD